MGAVPYVISWLGSDDIKYNDEPDLEQARALGAAQAIMVCIPWLICFCVYSGLLWSFPLDAKRVEAEKAEEEARAVDDMELVAGAVAPASSFTVASAFCFFLRAKPQPFFQPRDAHVVLDGWLEKADPQEMLRPMARIYTGQPAGQQLEAHLM